MFNCFKNKDKKYEYDILHVKVDGEYVVDYYPRGYIEMHYKEKCMEAKKLTEENEQLKAEVKDLEGQKLILERAVHFAQNAVSRYEEAARSFQSVIEELRQENEKLKQQVSELQSQLAQLKDKPQEQYELKVGDRVITKDKETKGTIFSISTNCKYNIAISTDSSNKVCIVHTHAGNLNRLVRKTPEFKVNDRVIFNTTDSPAIKGTVIEVKRLSLFIKTDDKELGMAIILTKHCKRLVKVKKVNCGHCSGRGWGLDLIGGRSWDCQNCNGTGKVRVKEIHCADCRWKGYISSCFNGWRDIKCKGCGGLGKIICSQ